MKPKNNYSKNIGSVISATMRPEDLIPAFVSELESQRPLSRVHRKLIREINQNMNADDYYEFDTADFDLEALFEALNDYCLPYFYFGAHPGDGSDYGYWLSDGFRDDFEQDGGLVVDDTTSRVLANCANVGQSYNFVHLPDKTCGE